MTTPTPTAADEAAETDRARLGHDTSMRTPTVIIANGSRARTRSASTAGVLGQRAVIAVEDGASTLLQNRLVFTCRRFRSSSW
jgi:hypothetical protein